VELPVVQIVAGLVGVIAPSQQVPQSIPPAPRRTVRRRR
jgi:hypothetical protein